MNLYSSDFRATADNASFLSTTYGRQLLWLGASLLIGFLIMYIDAVAFSMFAYIIYAVVLSILLLVFIFGVATHGARSWLEIGQFKIQPSEFAKFATGLALARFISINGFEFSWKNWMNISVTFGIILFPVILILLQPDVGSAIVYVSFILVLYREGLSANILLLILIVSVVFVLSLLMNQLTLLLILIGLSLIFTYIKLNSKKIIFRVIISLAAIFSTVFFITILFSLNFNLSIIITFSVIIWGIYLIIFYYRKKIKSNIGIILILFVAIFTQYITDFAFENLLEQHQRNRIEVLFDTSKDPKGLGYQLRQSKIAIGSGGFSGKGFLKGTQTKLDFVPEHNTDFIFCTVAEEWGFIGAVVLFLLYGLLLVRIVLKAEQQISIFSRIYGYSVAAIIFFHFFVNIGMSLGLLPIIGIPLPFFSYGGSAMLGFTILYFIFIKLDTEKDLKL